ncbi:hypothetical protein PENANT_c098G11147, partial [Penicillium antarcticum]
DASEPSGRTWKPDIKIVKTVIAFAVETGRLANEAYGGIYTDVASPKRIQLLLILGKTAWATIILLTVATAWVVCFYNFYGQHIQEVLGQYGARASLGANTITALYLAVAFSLGSNCMNIWLIRL